MKFQGLYTAIVTPFAGNRVDEEAFRMLVEAQIAARSEEHTSELQSH